MKHSRIGTCVRCVVLSASMLPLFACGGGSTAIAVALGSSGGGGGSSPPVVRSLMVMQARTPPATMMFELSDFATVALEFRLPRTSQWTPMRLSGDTNLVRLAPSPAVQTKMWEFADATQLGTAGFSPDIPIRVRIVGNGDAGTSSLTQGFGNDPSAIERISVNPGPGGEVTGLVDVGLTVTDSSDDRVSLDVEYDLLDDAPDAGFKPAAGRAVYPPVARQPSGFLWDVTNNLLFTEHDVLLRVTTFDGTAYGTPVVIPFRVDNNRAPSVVIDTANFVLNPDERRGIPIPFTVIDGDESTGEPGDDVTMVFQWRRVDGAYPAVDFSNVPQLLQGLIDPVFRREHQICTEIPRSFGGRVVPVDATHVRLPELASSASALVTRDPNTQEPRVRGALDILRASNAPTPIASTWSHDPQLHEPVAVLPIGPGLCGFVLERLGSSWRIRAIVFSTGEEVTTLGSGEGTPTAMAFDSDRRSLLVAVQLDVAGHWQIRRVRLQRDGAGRGDALVTADGSTELGPIRGITSLASQAALFTVGSSLIRADYPVGQPARAHALFGPSPLAPLREPWGVSRDPLNANAVFVAEHDADRIVRIDLQTRARTPLVANGIGLPRPESIALEQRGGPRRSARLLVITAGNADGKSRELRGLDLGTSVGSEVDRVFPTTPGAAGYSGTVGNIGLGRDGLRVIALTSTSDVAVGGGLEQRRRLLSMSSDYDLARQIVTIVPAFDPPVAASAAWRVHVTSSVVRGSARGTAGSFLWDSEDVVRGGDVFVRATPIDSEPGVSSDTAPTGRAKSLRPAIDVAPTLLGDSSTTDSPGAVIAADLDGDGDLDLVCPNSRSDNLALFFQTSPGRFDPVPRILGNSSTTDGPGSVIAADLDDDGDLDVACANVAGDNLAVFFQTSPGNFDPVPQILGNSSTTNGPGSVIAADLDGDGDLDLVCANTFGDNLAVFHQTSPGNFDPVPRIVGDPSTTSGPRSAIAADLDGDGDLDLACANAGFFGDNLAVFFQTSPGSFDPVPRIVGDSSTTFGPFSVIAADVDGDGDPDLVSANFSGCSVTVFSQTSPGHFDPVPLILGDISTTSGPASVIVADLDTDGDLDLVCASRNNFGLATFFQASPGHFDPVPQIVGDFSTTDGPVSVIAADLDGDGDLDLSSANASGDNLAVFFPSSPGRFDPTPRIFGDPSTTHEPVSVIAADIDGDGDVDLACANYFGDNLSVFVQSQTGNLEPVPTILGDSSTTSGPISVIAADLDGDGDLDLASANFLGDDLAVFFQTSPGSFDPVPLILGDVSTTAGPASVIAADLDSDGDLDLACANFSGNDMAVFSQTSPGRFDPVPRTLGNSSITIHPMCVVAADLDGDGALDLACANVDGNNLAVYFQTSAGDFDLGPQLLGNASTTNGPFNMTAADLDDDGDIDLACANFKGNDLSVFQQTTPGHFDPAPRVLGNVSTTYGPRSVIAADVDGDGDSDLVSANHLGDSLTVFRQASPGNFDPEPRILGDFSTTINPMSVIAADLDGDGDLDLVSANQIGENLTVFFNRD